MALSTLATTLRAATVTFPATGSTVVGNTSTAQTVPVTISVGGQLGAVKVLTTGMANLDFSISGAATCAIGNTYVTGQICNFPVTFRPKYPGQRFGAVVLVSGTLAPIAYDNGIDPLHFWMMVLVAFELGYLLPPVALNQLLARQVLGVEEMDTADNEVKSEPFFRRYERYILPVIVMTIGMLVVAYGPLIVAGK